MVGLPGTWLRESMRAGAIVQLRLSQVPETVKVAQRSGRAELGEDTWGPYYTEIDVNLKESARSRGEVMADVRKRLEGVAAYALNIRHFISERSEGAVCG